MNKYCLVLDPEVGLISISSMASWYFFKYLWTGGTQFCLFGFI